MRTFTFISAIGLLAIAVNAEQLTLKHHGNLNIDAMSFDVNHVSMQECNQMNYEVGRAIDWGDNGTPYSRAASKAKALETTVRNMNPQITETTPAWVSNLQEKARAYHAERSNREKRYEARVSKYSPTEVSIAKSMGLDPWAINKKDLKKWARETDSIIP